MQSQYRYSFYIQIWVNFTKKGIRACIRQRQGAVSLRITLDWFFVYRKTMEFNTNSILFFSRNSSSGGSLWVVCGVRVDLVVSDWNYRALILMKKNCFQHDDENSFRIRTWSDANISQHQIKVINPIIINSSLISKSQSQKYINKFQHVSTVSYNHFHHQRNILFI
jgi:hypothetical protein